MSSVLDGVCKADKGDCSTACENAAAKDYPTAMGPYRATDVQSDAARLGSLRARDVEEARTIREGFELIGSSGRPFIVRRCRITELAGEAFVARLAESEGAVFGWNKDLLKVGDLTLRATIDEWKRGTLAVNIVDAPIPQVFAAVEVDSALAACGITAEALMLVASTRTTHTPFHQDPPLEGGGWMWLAEGRKAWCLIDYEQNDALLDPATKTLLDMPMAELLSRKDLALQDNVWQGVIEGGDFIYFPPGCAHQVQTTQRSLGLGSYAVLPTDRERQEKITKWYLARGLDVAGGIWRGDKPVI